MPYSNTEQGREYDKGYKRRQRAAVFAKTEANLGLFESSVYIVRLDSVLY
jgi:hypothetical protein